MYYFFNYSKVIQVIQVIQVIRVIAKYILSVFDYIKNIINY
jgi:hypothetical protein